MTWLEIVVVNASGAPGRGKLEVELADGRVKQGTLGSDGKVRFSELPEGPCDVRMVGAERRR